MNYSFKSKLRMYINSSVVLIFFTVAALVCANIPGVKDWYASFWTQEVSLAIGDFNFFSHNGHAITLGQMINDFLMAVFFLSVGLEIKREIMVGELSSREKALLPVIGACGGMLVPVLIFYLVCPGDAAMQRGLAIPMATDRSPCSARGMRIRIRSRREKSMGVCLSILQKHSRSAQRFYPKNMHSVFSGQILFFCIRNFQ